MTLRRVGLVGTAPSPPDADGLLPGWAEPRPRARTILRTGEACLVGLVDAPNGECHPHPGDAKRR